MWHWSVDEFDKSNDFWLTSMFHTSIECISMCMIVMQMQKKVSEEFLLHFKGFDSWLIIFRITGQRCIHILNWMKHPFLTSSYIHDSLIYRDLLDGGATGAIAPPLLQNLQCNLVPSAEKGSFKKCPIK